MAMPVGQEYRDLVKLIPGVQYTNDQTRGPSAGGSGQDNVYQFDGVNVTLPLFGTLSAEPASHDIAQVTTTKGGARAVDFDRSGGFSIDSVSKSGANRFAGEVSYQFQTAGNDRRPDERRAVALRRRPQLAHGQCRRPGDSRTASISTRRTTGRRTRVRTGRISTARCRSTTCTRDEGFGKVTVTPASSVLLNFSYRGSDREDRSNRFAANQAATTGSGNEAQQQIGIAEGSWVVNSSSLADVQVHALRLRDDGNAGHHLRRDLQRRHRDAARHRQPRSHGPPDRAGADRRPDAPTTPSSSR